MTAFTEEQAAERKAEKRARVLSHQQELHVLDTCAHLLTTREGRAFVWYFFELTGVDRNPYGEDGRKTEWNCGAMNVGLIFRSLLIQANPEAYANMLKEQYDATREYNTQRELDNANARAADDPLGSGNPDDPDLFDEGRVRGATGTAGAGEGFYD